MVKQQFGFSLIEIIVVLIVLGIAAAMIGPFLSNILGNYIQSREIAERERQAGLILERFVRDARMSQNASIHNSCTTLRLPKKSGYAEYKLADNSLTFKPYNTTTYYTLSHNISSICFNIRNFTDGYNLITMNLEIELPDDQKLQYHASAVSRWD